MIHCGKQSITQGQYEITEVDVDLKARTTIIIIYQSKCKFI